MSEPEVSAWIAGSRLNLLRALPEHLGEPPVQMAVNDFTQVGAAIERLKQIDGSGSSGAAGAVQA